MAKKKEHVVEIGLDSFPPALSRDAIRQAVREAIKGTAKEITGRVSGKRTDCESVSSVPLNAVPVPKSFMLGGKTFRVTYDENISYKEGLNGHIFFEMNTVRLQPNAEGCTRTQEDIERVFLHELTHGILYTIGKRDLSNDEEFVNAFSNCLHQALKTAKYGE